MLVRSRRDASIADDDTGKKSDAAQFLTAGLLLAVGFQGK